VALRVQASVFVPLPPPASSKSPNIDDIAIHPDELLLDGGESGAHPAMPGTPIRPLDSNQEIAWIPATDLATGTCRWLPADYCYRSANRADAAWTCPADSSGCATGTSMADVAVRGFLEAVERDAVGIWWFNRVHRRECPTEDATIKAVAAWQRDRSRRFHLLDLTTDLGVPVRAAVSFEKSGRGIAVGFGAHFDPTIAALRASLEMVQFQVMIDLSLRLRDRGLVQEASPSTKDAWSWFEGVTVDTEPYLLPQPAESTRPLHPPPTTDGAALDRCIEIANDHCLELLFVEMTRPWIGIPAGRVIVPGLRSIKRRFGDGRLYDVPVKLGWLPAARTSAELNPRNIVF
jgi:oxazoline/thiazoline synthase